MPKTETLIPPAGTAPGPWSTPGSPAQRRGDAASAAAPAEVRRRSDLMVGGSAAMNRVLELIQIVARTDVPVLLLGESGTGKELAARAIHYGGARAARPFITLNCGAIPEPLMEDELFGHARGAYTGAHADKKGVFEEAEGGTLFLDEIAELPSSCQVKLLRVLQEMEVRRLGETLSRRVNVRILAATNRDLRKVTEERRFREDLFHRISVLPIEIPPLRDRRDDIPVLVDHFMRQFNRELGRTIRAFTPRALDRLRAHAWPGNIRELENRIKQAMVMATSEMVDSDALSLPPGAASPTPHPSADTYPTFRRAKAEFERGYVIQTLRLAGGRVAAAARLAGKDRKDFYDLMKKHTINPDDYRV